MASDQRAPPTAAAASEVTDYLAIVHIFKVHLLYPHCILNVPQLYPHCILNVSHLYPQNARNVSHCILLTMFSCCFFRLLILLFVIPQVCYKEFHWSP